MKKKAIVIICLCSCIMFGCKGEANNVANENTTYHYTYEGYYEYPTSKSDSASSILNKCRISEDILKTMSSEQLAQAVADFPLLFDVCLSSSELVDTTILSKECDAYKELLSRKDGKSALMEKIDELTGNEEYEIKIEILNDVLTAEKRFN